MGETSAMSSLLADLALVVTQVFTWVGTVSTTIVGDPLLLLTTGFLVLGKRHNAESKSGKIGKNLEQAIPRKTNIQIAY